MSLRIGYKASAEQFGLPELVELAVQAEKGIPIYIAAGGPVVAKYAGRASDGFICTSGKAMELYTEKLITAVSKALPTAAARLGLQH